MLLLSGIIKGDGEVGDCFDGLKDVFVRDVSEVPVELGKVDGLDNGKVTLRDFMETGRWTGGGGKISSF